MEWRPFAAGGRTLVGPEELRDYFREVAAGAERQTSEIRDVEACGDAVLVSGVLHREVAGETTSDELVWLYLFRDGRLVRASAHPTRAAALAAAKGVPAPGVPPPFALETRSRAAGHVVVAARGELDLATAPRLEDAVRRAGAPRRELDLRELAFLDGAGLRVLVRLAKTALDEGWSLAIIPPAPHVGRVMALVGVQAALPLAESA